MRTISRLPTIPFERLRRRVVGYPGGEDDAEAWVAAGVERSLNAGGLLLPDNRINEDYIGAASYSAMVDELRKASGKQREAEGVVEPSIHDHPEVRGRLVDAFRGSPDRAAFELLDATDDDGRPLAWAAIAQRDGSLPEDRLRKEVNRLKQACKRLRDEQSAVVVANMFERGEIDTLNRYRLDRALMQRVATVVMRRHGSPRVFIDAFVVRDANRALQNSTWALASLLRSNADVRRFLVEHLHGNELFRGNTTYTAEALLNVDPVAFAPDFRRYLDRLEDLPGRIVADARSPHDQPAALGRTIVDVMPISRFDQPVPRAVVDRLEWLFWNTDDWDLQRTAAWQLLRIKTYRNYGVRTVMSGLPHLEDQVGAFYILRWLGTIGLRTYPRLLLTRQTAKIVRQVRCRFPQNPAFYALEWRMAALLNKRERGAR